MNCVFNSLDIHLSLLLKNDQASADNTVVW